MRTITLIILALALIVAPVHAGDVQKAIGAYKQGEGKTALKKFKPLAERGNADAHYDLGVQYDKGTKVPRNYKEAVKWYRKAAKRGHALAQYHLGVMYDKGKGVIKDDIEAHKWFNLAGANGSEMGRKVRDKIARRMTPGQIAEAQTLAKEWMENIGRKKPVDHNGF